MAKGKLINCDNMNKNYFSQGFKKRSCTVISAVTKRYLKLPLPFSPILTVRKKITAKTPLQPRQHAVTAATTRCYGRETPLRPQNSCYDREILVTGAKNRIEFLK
jgi:hypothetical protein